MKKLNVLIVTRNLIVLIYLNIRNRYIVLITSNTTDSTYNTFSTYNTSSTNDSTYNTFNTNDSTSKKTNKNNSIDENNEPLYPTIENGLYLNKYNTLMKENK